jgi:hypothetical protein
MRILSWHVHAAWSTAFLAGPHEYIVPVLPDRGPYGRGRARTYAWPGSVVEASPEQLRQLDLDLVVLQRPEEEELAQRWTGRRLPAVYVEHNTPRGDGPNTRHPCADRDDLTIVHVTHFNDLFWDCGGTRTVVIEHGVPEPAARWTGELPRLAVVTNEPVRRGRITGTDLIGRFAAVAPVDVFGLGLSGLDIAGVTPVGDLPPGALHPAVARRRAYLHLTRWTSLGLSLIEAMLIGCPVVVLATTEAVRAVPAHAGVLSTDVSELVEAAGHYLTDLADAGRTGARARRAAQERYGLPRFLADWERLLAATLPSTHPAAGELAPSLGGTR